MNPEVIAHVFTIVGISLAVLYCLGGMIGVIREAYEQFKRPRLDDSGSGNADQ